MWGKYQHVHPFSIMHSYANKKERESRRGKLK